MKIAKEKGLPQLKHHLLPRAKGFVLIASTIAGKISYLYDINLAVKKLDQTRYPKLNDLFDGKKFESQCYIRRIPLSDINLEDPKKCADFLFNLYKEKVYLPFYNIFIHLCCFNKFFKSKI